MTKKKTTNKPTIACVMIVKNEEEVLERCIDSVKQIVTEYIIVDTGSTDSTKDIIKKYGKLYEIPFENFVKTKNDALKIADKSKCDYILWMDADEYFINNGAEKLMQHIINNPALDYIITDIQDVYSDENIIVNEYTRVRLWKNHKGYKFEGPGIHEYINCTNGTPLTDRSIKIHHKHKTKGKDYKANFEFYIKTMTAWLEEHPNDLRALFYLGETYRFAHNFRRSNEYYMRYLSLPNHYRDEMYWASYCIAQNYYYIGDIELALKELDRTISLDTRRAEAYYLKGFIYFWIEDWDKCIQYLETAYRCEPMPDVSHFTERDKYDIAPLDFLAIAYERVGRLDDAYETTKILNSLKPKEIRYENNRKYYWGKIHPTVVFYMGWSFEPLYENILEKQGLGGIETSHIQLAKAMAEFGWNVIIFGNVIKDFKENGVLFTNTFNYEKLINEIAGDVVIIASRDFKTAFSKLKEPTKFKKIIWLQDPFSEPGIFKINEKFYDKIVVSSQWHKHQLMSAYKYAIHKEDIEVIPLTIDKKYYEHLVDKVPYRIIYSSSPNRGLTNLLGIWPAITKILPKAELHLFYGWDTLKMYLNEERWKPHYEIVEKAIKENPNIIDHGKVSKEELAIEQMKAQLCVFPNNATETFCLTAIELAMAGTPMVYSSVGAMIETVNRNYNLNLLVDTSGMELSAYGAEIYLKEIVKLFREVNQTRLKRWSEMLRKDALENTPTWFDIANIWKYKIIFNKKGK